MSMLSYSDEIRLHLPLQYLHGRSPSTILYTMMSYILPILTTLYRLHGKMTGNLSVNCVFAGNKLLPFYRNDSILMSTYVISLSYSISYRHSNEHLDRIIPMDIVNEFPHAISSTTTSKQPAAAASTVSILPRFELSFPIYVSIMPVITAFSPPWFFDSIYS